MDFVRLVSVVPSCLSRSALVVPRSVATSAIAFWVASSRVLPAASYSLTLSRIFFSVVESAVSSPSILRVRLPSVMPNESSKAVLVVPSSVATSAIAFWVASSRFIPAASFAAILAYRPVAAASPSAGAPIRLLMLSILVFTPSMCAYMPVAAAVSVPALPTILSTVLLTSSFVSPASRRSWMALSTAVKFLSVAVPSVVMAFSRSALAVSIFKSTLATSNPVAAIDLVRSVRTSSMAFMASGDAPVVMLLSCSTNELYRAVGR